MEENNFIEGLVMDSPNYQTKNTVLTDALNIRLLTMDGNEYILQTMDGNNITGTTQSLLKPNYVPIGVRVYAGVAYIISALFENEIFVTGEIGTYPSPNYEQVNLNSNGNWEGNVVYDYRPLMNFKSDYNGGLEDVVMIGEFNTELFNFNINFPVYDIELQNSYDGTINVIFTDNFNVPRLINTRIAFKGSRFEIINRRGADSNIYNNESFNTTIKLQQQSRKLVNVEFTTHGGGELQAGSYSYYFYYETEEGFRTPIKFQSLPVSVYDGDNAANIKGTRRNNVTSEYLATTKSNKFALSNLDTQFPYLRVIFCYTSGEVGEITVTRLIDNRYRFNAYFEFEHFGVESYQDLQIEELSLIDASITKARTITQLNNRLFIGNIEQRDYPIEVLEAFTAKIKLKQEIHRTAIELNKTEDFNNLYSPIIFSTIDNQSQANSKVLYYRLGYWAEESYIFGIIYIMSDGSESPVILLNSFDSLSTATGDDLPKGLFRTGLRKDTTGNLIPLVNEAASQTNNTTVNNIYIQLDFNDAINELGLPADTLGFKIVRSKRNKNAITQGYVVNTVPVPLSDYLDANSKNKSLQDYGNLSKYRIEGSRTAKLIPTPGFQFEAPVAYGNVGNKEKDNSKVWSSVHSLAFNGSHYNDVNRNGEPNNRNFDTTYAAFYSPDAIVKEEEYAKQFTNTQNTIKYLYQVDACNSLRANTTIDAENKSRLPIMTCFKPIKYNVTNEQVKPINAEYCFGHLDQTNALGFTSVASCNVWTSSNLVNSSNFEDDFVELRSSFNGYLGIKHGEAKQIYNAVAERVDNLVQDAEVICNETNNILNFGFQNKPYNTLQIRKVIEVANIYGSGGIRPSNQLKSIYNVDTETFFPITNNIYWNRAKADETKSEYIYGVASLPYEGQVNGVESANYDKTLQGGSYVLNVYGGDCFIGLCFRRIFINSIQRTDDTISGNDSNTGFYLCIVTESNENPYLRNEEVVDINEESNRSFAPIYTSNQNYVTGWSTVINPNNFQRTNDWHTWRKYRQPETDGYNRGYGTTETFRRYFYVLNVPFVKAKFSTRIYYSDLFVNGGFENAYRYIQAVNYKDYSSRLGAIVKIIGKDNGLVCVHENGVELIPVSQRTIINNDGTQAGQIYVDSLGVLAEPSNTQILSDDYGSTWQGSICRTDNTVYGTDIERERIWRINNGLELISEFNIQTWINSYFDQYKGQIPIIAKRDVKTYFDAKTKDVWFVFYNRSIVECGSCNTVLYQNLEQYVNGVSTGLIVPNVESDPNYIPPFEGECPYPNQEPGVNICGTDQIKVNNNCVSNNVLILNSRFNNPNPLNAIDNTTTSTNVAGYSITSSTHKYNNIQVILPQPKTVGVFQFLELINIKKAYTESSWLTNMNGNRNLISNEYTDEYAYSGTLRIDTSNNYIDYNSKQFGISFTWVWKNNFYAQNQYSANQNQNLSDIVVTVTNPTNTSTVFNIQGTTINYFVKEHLFEYNYTQSGVYTINVKLYHRNILLITGTVTGSCGCELDCDSFGNCICPCPPVELPNYEYQDVLVGEYTFFVTIPNNTNNEEWLGRDAICIEDSIKGTVIIYNERLNKWITFTSCEPIEMFNLYNRLHSFALKDSEQIWEHHANNYSNFYGNQYQSFFEYVVGAGSIGVAKMFDNLEIISNDEAPIQMVINNDNEINLTQNILSRSNNSIIKANQDYRESYHYITIGKNVVNEPVTYKRVRDKYCKFKIIYRGDRQFIIRGIKTIIRQSYA